MTLKLPVPRISITSDVEDDDDNEDNSYMNLQDVLTDYEDLDNEDDPITNVINNNNSKLKLSQNKSDVYLTDVEDVESSDIEDENKIVNHSRPVNSKIFDINPGVLEETYKIKSKKSRERKKLKSQVTVTRSSQTLNKPFQNDESGMTDFEDLLASDDDFLSNDNIPDSYFPPTMLEEIEDTNINDGMNFNKSSSILSNEVLNQAEEKNKLTISCSTKNNLTDIEVVSDAECEVAIKKSKRIRRRRPKGTLRNQGAITDIEDIDMTNEEAKLYKSLNTIPNLLNTTNTNKKSNLYYQSQSFLYDSDNEEEDPTILRKNRKKISNLVVDNVCEGLTDIDDVNMTDSDNDYNYNCSAMEAELKKLSDAYGSVHDVASKVNEDLCYSDEKDSDENNSNDSKYNISFKKLEIQNPKYLVLPNQIQSVLTDVESIYSSDEEKDKKLPVAILEKVSQGYKTDEEIFSDDEEVQYYTDFKSLPKVFRKIIVIKENKHGEPTVKVLPLDDSCNQYLFPLKDDLNNLTDVENMSDNDNDEELLQVNNVVRGATPDILFMEETQVNESECSKGGYESSNEMPNISECKTDIEEIYVDHKKRIKKLTKKSTKLEVNTDCEELSDCSEKIAPIVRQTADVTDTENMELSENDIEVYTIPICSQSYYSNMEGELTITQEGNDCVSKNTTLLNVNVIKCTNKIFTPVVTDSEDIAISTEEDNYDYICKDTGDCFDKLLSESSCTNISSKYTKKINLNAPGEKQYLKGCLDTHTDIEELEVAEAAIEAVEDINIDKNISIDWKNKSVVFGSCSEEWEASREEAEEEQQLENKNQENIDGDTRMAGEVTYESVLLTNLNRNIPYIPPTQTPKIKSYTEIDLMLDKMLIDIEEILPTTDLDSSHINTLELVPTNSATIEVPIKKTNPTFYESTLDMEIDELDNFDLICFKNNVALSNVDDEYDLISFNSKNENYFLPPPETNSLENFFLSHESYLPSIETNFSENVQDTDQLFNDYETIDPLSYKRYNDIWWEGTYRNLSIVPEEDEENLSSVSKTPLVLPHANTDEFSNTSDTEASTDSSDETQGTAIKAEVKLLVKTSNEGKEEIEVCSVKEFLENRSKSNNTNAFLTKPNDNDSKSLTKSNTYFLDTSNYSKSNKPVFTLQRLFIRTPIEQTINYPEQNSYNTALELVPEPNSNYPLKYNSENEKSDEPSLDLFANSPFYPCYDLPAPNYFVSSHNSPIEFVEYSQDFNPPKAYCDWVTQMDTEYKGLTSPSAKVKSEDSLDIVKADAHVDKLDNEKSVKTLNIKPPIMSKDISSETLTLIKTKEIVDPIAIKVEEKKEKKGIINTLKSFVTKSFDQSDSESEKSQEIKGKKKGKKSKSKSQLKNNETINKPKIDNIPLQEPEHFKNLPYVEVSPNADDNHEISVDIDRKEDSRMQLLENNKQTKDFNLDIHKGIKDIEDEILLNETANKKPFINIYDNETAPVISEPKNLLNDDDQSSDIKLKTYNLIQNEISFQGWADDKYNAKPNQLNEKSSEMSKSKLQPTKLFGFLSGKSSRDSETSEDDKTDKQKEIIEKQDKEDSKEIGSVKHDSKNSGIFDVFTKKGKKYLTKTPFKEDQNVDKELNVIMKSTNDFIDHEVKNYDNSSPTKIEAISKKTDIDETIVKKREKREKSTEPEKRRSGLLNFIFGKEENRIENETAEKLSKGTNEIVESSTIGDPNKAGTSSNIENTKQFLMNELTSYEDNEISNENTIAPSHETIEEPVKIKKGVFNLFSKKDAGPGKDEELHTKQTKNNMNELQVKKKIKSPLFSNKKEKIEIKLPESVLKDISECNSFLKLEIDNYYDEKILNEKLPEIILEIPTVSPKKDSKKGIFNIFVKKERKDVDQNTNIKTNEDVIEDTKNKEPEIVTIAGNSKVQQFLDTEIINYDCPTGVKFAMVETTDKDTSLKASDSFDKTQEVIQSKETKTVDKAEKIIKEVIQETSQPIAIDIQQLSSSNLPNEDLHLRHDTDSFLKTEIINYHDVKSKVALKEDLQKNKEKYIFYKKSESTDKNEKKQKNKIKKESSDSADDSDSQTKSTKFSLFKKREKTQPVPEIIKEATPSENVVSYIVNTHGNIKSTQDFLQIEKTKYSDSKTSKVVDLENMDIKKPTTKSEKSKKLVLSESGDESDSCTKSSKFRLFGKPKKEKSVEKYEAEVSIVDKSPKSINKDKVINLPEIIPSEDIVSTNNFIQTEINNYEDVKLEPMQSSVNEPIIYSPESADESDKSAVKIHKSLFGKKVHKKHHTPTAKLDKGHDEDSKKYADNEKTKRKSSNKFKKGESSESGEESDGTKKSSKYKLFSRKKKADKEKTAIKEASSKEILDDSIIDSKVFTQNFLIEEVERYQDVKLMYPTNQESDVLDSIENKKIKFNLINKLIKKSKKEETDNKLEGHLLTVRDTTEFLSNEHTHYDDVKTFDPKNNITDELLHEGNEVIEQEQELLQKPQISTLNAEGPKPVIKVPDKKATPLSHDILVSMKNTQEFLTKEVSNYDGKDFNDKSKSNKVGDTGKKEVTFQTDQINTLKDVLTAVDLKSVSENSEISQKTILVKTIVFNSAQEVLDSSTDIENDIETEDEDKTQKIEIESKKDTLPSKKKKGIFTKMFLGKSKDQTSTEISASNDTDLEKNDEFTEKKIPKKSKGLLTKLSEKIGSVEKKFESTKGSVILKSVSGEYTPKEIVSTDSKGISEKPRTSCITQATEINHFLDHEKNNVFNGGLEQSNIEINDKEQLFDEPKNDFKDNAKAKETDVMKSKPDKKKNQGIFDKIFSSNKNKSKGDTSVPGEEKLVEGSQIKANDLEEPKDAIITKKEVSEKVKSASDKTISIKDTLKDTIKESDRKLKSDLERRIDRIDNSFATNLTDIKEETNKRLSETEKVNDDITLSVLNVLKDVDIVSEKTILMKDTLENKIKEGKTKIESDTKREIQSLDSSVSSELVEIKEYTKVESNNLLSSKEIVKEEVTSISTSFKTMGDTSANTILIKDDFIDKIQESKGELSSDLKQKLESLDIPVTSTFKETKENFKIQTDKLFLAEEIVKDETTHVTTSVITTFETKTISMKDIFEDKIKESKEKLESGLKEKLESAEDLVSSQLVDVQENFQSETHKLVSAKQMVKDEIAEIAPSTKATLTKVDDESAKVVSMKDNLKDIIEESKVKLESDLKEKCESIDSSISSKLVDIKKNIKGEAEKIISAKQFLDDKVEEIAVSTKESEENLESDLKKKPGYGDSTISSKLVDVKENIKSEAEKLVPAIKIVKDEIAAFAVSTKATLNKADDASAKTVLMMDNLKDKITDSKVALESDLKQKLENIDSSVSSKLVDIKKTIESENDKILSEKEVVKDKVTEIAASAEGTIKKVYDATVKTSSINNNLEDTIKESKADLESDIKKKIETPDSLISSKLVDIKENIKDETNKILSTKETIKGDLTKITSSVKTGLKNVSDASILIKDDFKDKAEEIKGKFETDLGYELKTVESTVSSKIVDIKDNIKNETDKILLTEEIVKDKLAKNASSTLQKVDDKLSTTKIFFENTIIEGKARLESDLKQKLRAVDSSVPTKFIDIKENITSESDKILLEKESIKDEIASSVKTTLEKVDDASAKSITIKNNFVDKVQENQEKLKSDLEQKLDTVDASVSSKLVDIKENIQGETNKLLSEKEKIKEGIKEIGTTLKTGLTKFNEASISIKDNITDEVKNSKATLQSDLEQKLETVDASVSSKLIDIKENIKSKTDNILTSKESAKDEIKEIASSVKATLGKVDDVPGKTFEMKNRLEDKIQDNKAKLESDLKLKLETVDASVSSNLEDIKGNIKGETKKLLSEKEKIKDEIKDIQSSVKIGLKHFDEPSFSIKNTFKDEVKESTVKLQSDLKQKLETVDSSVSSKLIDIKENVNSETDKILTSKENVKDEIRDIASAVKTTIGKVDDVSGKTFAIKNNFEEKIQENKAKLESDLKGKLEIVHASVSSKLEDIKGNIKGETNTLLSEEENIKGEIKDIESSVNIGLKNLYEAAVSKGTIKDDFKDGTIKLQSDLKQKVETVDSSVSSKLMDLKDNIERDINTKDSIEDEMKEIASSVKTNFRKVDDLSAIKNNFEEKNQENKAKLESGLKQKLETVDASVSLKLEDIKGKIKGETNTLLSEKEKIKVEIKDIESSVKTGLKNLDEASVSIKGTFKDDFKEGTVKLQSDLKQKLETVDSSVSSKLIDIQEDIKCKTDKILPSKESVKVEIKKIASSVKATVGKMDDVSGKTFEMKNNFEDKIQDNKAKLESDLKQKLETVVSSKLEDIQGNIKGETNKLCSKKEKIKGDIKDIESSVKIGLTNLDEASVSITDTFKGEVKESSVKLQSDLKQKQEIVDSSISSKLLDIKENIKCETNNLRVAKENVQDGVKEIESSIKSTLEKIDDASAETITKQNNFSDKIKGIKINLESNLKQKFETIDDSISSKLVDVKESIKDETTKLLSEKESIKEEIKDIGSSVKTELRNLDDEFISIKNEVKESKAELGSDLKQKLETFDSTVVSNLVHTKERIKDETDQQVSSNESVGTSNEPKSLSLDLAGELISTSNQNNETKNGKEADVKRSPIFRIESEEEVIDISLDRRDSVRSNILEIISDQQISEMVTELDMPGNDTLLNEITNNKIGLDLKEKTMDDSSKIDKTEKKLKRVEKKFERMASEIIEQENSLAKELNITSPEMETKRDSEFKNILSQLSTEEVADLQKEYSTLWDEQTFSHTDEWDSKTPESQAEVIDLPQGEIVYMAPVTLNKNNLVNKAGIQVEVIPRMRSPYASPKPRRKKQRRRPKSALGFYENGGSLPDLNNYIKSSIMDAIMSSPQNFLKTECNSISSMYNSETENINDKSVTKSEPLKGELMNAVVDWLTKSKSAEFLNGISTSSTDVFLCKDESMSTNSTNLYLKESDDILSSFNKETKTGSVSLTYSTDQTLPQPIPRSSKVSNQLELLSPLETEISTDKITNNDSLITEIDSYSDRKKFWENVTKDNESDNIKKKTSPPEETQKTAEPDILMQPPIPKPRLHQNIQSNVESSTSDEDVVSKPLSEYQRSYQNPQDLVLQDEKRQNIIESKESIDSDNENSYQHNLSSGYENTGYISDSGDVEQYISDSEIEDRVPQIRERQMSVFQPPTPSLRKSIYERSCSLPTEDLYEVSAQSILLRKQMFEEQIKKDMVDDVLMTEIEEEPSPEHKTLKLPNLVEEEEPSGVKSVPESAVCQPSDFPEMEKLNNKISLMEKAEALILDEDYDVDNNLPLVDKENDNFKDVDMVNIIEKASIADNQALILEEQQSGKIVEHTIDTRSDKITAQLEESLEMHVDKSEIEASEKKIEISENDIQSCTDDIPEITVSLSGIQKRISEESDEAEDKDIAHNFQTTQRSEAGSPINHPEECLQETVWEVSIQSQPQTYEEIVTDIQLQSHGIVEKDDDFSGSVRDESDLGSEIHQDHSESYGSDHRSDSQADIEKLILESLHHQKISPEEAKLIASELVADIEAEIHQRGSFDDKEPPAPEYAKNQVSDYLRQLAEAKGLDSREVQLVQSVLARKQREITKLSRGDTQASSIEITDEDLRYSGNEISPSCSLSNILEEQIDKLEEQKIKNNVYDSDEIEEPISTKLNITTNKVEAFTVERSTKEHKDVIFEEDEITLDSGSERTENTQKSSKDQILYDEEVLSSNKEDKMSSKLEETTSEQMSTRSYDNLTSTITENDMKVQFAKEMEEDYLTTTENLAYVEKSSRETLKDKIIEENEIEVNDTISITDENLSTKIDNIDHVLIDNGVERRESAHIESIKQSKTETFVEDSHKESIIVSTQILSDLTSVDVENILESKIEIIGSNQIFSDDSKSSEESFKSPEDFMSTSSSKKEDDESKLQKDEVVFRKVKRVKDESSSTSSNLKPDRKSGIDFETYSSSGESHYQSFEIDSNKSRPCSSDIDVVIAAGSSDYESALTSQDLSAPLHLTSTEYHTAVSSISSKESMKSLDSESSGNLASVEVSEASETLVPSEFEFCVDGSEESKLKSNTDVVIQRQNTDLSESEIPFDTHQSLDLEEEFSTNVDIPSKMKRSQEMTFQPEPKSLVPDSPHFDNEDSGDIDEKDEKLGASVEDGSILSMSLSSTSSINAQRTVIELSHTDSEKLDAGMSMSNLSEQLSFEDSEYIGSRENLSFTPTINTTNEMSTSTQMLPQTCNVNNVTLTTSVINENGIQSAGTQVVTQINTTSEFTEQKKRGHRRTDSTTFVSNKFTGVSSLTEIEKKIQSDLAESDKYTHPLSLKESDSFDKKDFGGESYETEADQGLHRDISEGKYAQSELDDREKKNIIQAASSSKTENLSSIEQFEIKSLDENTKITQDVTKKTYKDILDKRDSHGKSSSNSSEKSSFEEAEAEAAFNMVAHTSPAHKIKQICPIMEDEDAEKHELETREKAQKDLEKRIAQLKDQSPGAIPDIKVTQHMTPLDRKGFHYPDLELEEKEIDMIKSTPETPASNSSKSSESTDQGHEYVIDDSETSIPEESESQIQDEKTATDSKSEIISIIEKTIQYETDKETVSPTESPNSDSFEILEKPDIMDEFVVIEEVAKEAQETDMEGKSLKISRGKISKKHDEEVEQLLVRSAPSPSTKMTDIKYYPDGSSSDELGFDFEDSPPGQKGPKGSTSPRDYVYEYDKELEANKKWIEQQFQGDHAAMIAAGYGYEMDFERCPLEDIKEEDGNDFDSSRIGSLNSQKESGGSFGSVKDSYSSTPEYDVLAGRRYFTKSGEHDDVSMSSLQEFENLERAMSLETRKFHQGSQDSSSNGSFKTRYFGRSGQGDDISVSSLKEFEGLEKACIAAHKVEIKVKEEEMLLTQIDEGAESMTSESESCETITSLDNKVVPESDEEDYEKRMFEIDEIIRQAQTNVERFIDLKDGERTESIGRGDSVEEVSKIPDLELDIPIAGGVKVKWNDGDDIMQASIDSLDVKADKPSHHGSADSLDQKTGGDIMTASTDSIEFQAQKNRSGIVADSLDFREPGYTMTSSDSLELATGSNIAAFSDSIDEDGSKLYGYDQSSSSTGKDLSAKEDDYFVDNNKVLCDLLESTDSIASTSAGTHATYQYETDSVFSGSFTSGGSNTMVSSTDNIETTLQESVNIADAVKKVWFEDQDYLEDGKPYVTEIIEPGESDITRYTFKGPDVDQKLKQFIDNFNEGETVHEERTVDPDGSIHIKRTVQNRVILKDNIEKVVLGDGLSKTTVIDNIGVKTIYSQDFKSSEDYNTAVQSILTTIAGECSGETSSRGTRQENEKQSGSQARSSFRKPLPFEISLDDRSMIEVDLREHDWKFSLANYAESDEAFADVETTIRSATSETINSKQTPKPKEETDKE